MKKTLIVITAFAVGVSFLVHHWMYTKTHPSTEDAYLKAHLLYISPSINGTLQSLPVHENQWVEKNQILATINPATFRHILNGKRANLSLALQSVQGSTNAIDAARSLVAKRQAELDIARKEATRADQLSRLGQLPLAKRDQADAQLKMMEAAYQASVDQMRQAESTLGTLGKKNPRVLAALSELNIARDDLKATTIKAPTAGWIQGVRVRPGTRLTRYQPIMAIVEADSWWVDAHFKETDLSRIKPGQPAYITLDLAPSTLIQGNVISISKASGATFALLPPENASGNWVKVTQRFTVRVGFSAPDEVKSFLRVGASAKVTVDTTEISDNTKTKKTNVSEKDKTDLNPEQAPTARSSSQ